MLQLTKISAFVQRKFPEREFHYRASGAVRYFRLSTETQLAATGAVFFILCWTVALSMWAFIGTSASSDQTRLERRLIAAQADASAAQQQQIDLEKKIAALQSKTAKTLAELKRNREQFSRAMTLKGSLVAKAQKPKLAPDAKARFLAAELGKRGANADTVTADPQRDSKSTTIPRTIFSGAGKLADTAIGAGIAKLDFSIAGIKARNRTLLAERDKLWNRVASLRAGMNRMRSGRAVLLTRLDKRTQRNIDEIERVIVMTGLDPKELLNRLNKNGKGGPAIVVPAAYGASDEYAIRVIRLTQRLRRWENLQAILRSMPLIAPLDHYRKSSGFGKRRDPMSGRWSSHNGLDFAYHRNSPVLSTAGGTVTFAGWRGGYGWMIEIDHGMGIRTRYAHLKKILVEKGQKLAFREKIGLLGSSGRSSGPHVHYEVVVDGRPQNPMKFITAGKYVFKR